MKLIYLTVATIPNKTAHSKYVMKLCEAFFNQGVDTTLISCVRKEDILKKEHTNFKLLRLIAPYNIFGKEILNLRFKYYSYLVSIYILYYKLFFKDLIFICHNIHTVKVCEILKVKYILDLHDDFPKLNISPLFIIVQSNVLYEKIKSKYTNTNILLSRNAVSEVKSVIKPEKFLENNKRLKFGYVGRLKPGTGFHEIVEAINNISFDFILYVGGDYEKYRSYYEDLFLKYPNAKNKIVFLGYLNDEQINYLSQNADVLIALYSSKIDIFGTLSPMKIFEYLRFNKRIIAPKIPDIEEIIDYYACNDRMRWYEIDNITSLKKTIENVLIEDNDMSFKRIDLETWDDKAKNILERI
jgi:glycosyltransferase involved in cell wall biosynthesis